jgi:hypothetical protein
LLVATCPIGLLAVTLTYIGAVALLFNFVPLPPHLLFASLAIVVLYISVTELTKRWYFAEAARNR